MVKWWHRAKVVFVGIPVMMLVLFVFLLVHLADALREFWQEDGSEFFGTIRSEWTDGAEDAARRVRGRAD